MLVQEEDRSDMEWRTLSSLAEQEHTRQFCTKLIGLLLFVELDYTKHGMIVRIPQAVTKEERSLDLYRMMNMR